jgi:hypothetical protein
MTQVLDRSPSITKYIESKFYLLAVSDFQTLYWDGSGWGVSQRTAKIFATHKAAEQEQPQARKKAPLGMNVIVWPEA